MSVTGEQWFVEKLAKTRPLLCIDVGANVGHYSKALLEATGATVFAFEPLPGAFIDLSNLSRFYGQRIQSFNMALGNTSGLSNLYYGDSKSELASLSKEVNSIEYVGASNKSKMEVRVERLDYFFEELRKVADEIDFLKIDVEGLEFEVLDGSKKILEEMKPKLIQLEFNYHQLFRGHSLLSIGKLLGNYRMFQLLPKGAGIVERHSDDPLSNIYSYSNFIFLRSDLDPLEFQE